MHRRIWIANVVALSLVCTLAAAPRAMAQGDKPVMENVFFNVVWGSATGALLGAAAAVIGSEDKRRPNGLRRNMFEGATGGGIIGLSVGIWLIFSGITFDPDRSTIIDVGRNDTRGEGQGIFASAALPLQFQTTTRGPLRITGFKALVLNLRF